MNLLKMRKFRLVYFIGVALLLVSLCAGIFAVPQVYAGSTPSGCRHAAAGDGGGGSGSSDGGTGAPAGSTSASTPAEQTPAGDEGSGTGEGTGGPSVYTDKADYAPYESPVITGTGFAPNADIMVTITAADGTISYVTGSTDAGGNFTALYEGFLCEGAFSLSATDGINTAVNTFTDGPSGSHTVTFRQTGLEYALVGGGTIVLSIGQSGSTLVPFSSIDGAPWYTRDVAHNEKIYYSYSAIVDSTASGTRFELKGVSGISSGSRVRNDETVTANYGKQYQLTVVSAHGSTTPAAGGEYWYDAGTNLNDWWEKPYVSDLEVEEGGTTYTFSEWTGDGGSDEIIDWGGWWGTVAYTHDFTMDGPRTIEAVWTSPTTYYDVTFTQTGLESGLVSGVTLVLTVDGTNVFYSSIDGSPWYTTSIEEGDPINYSYSTEVAANTAGTQFALKSVTGLATGAPVYCNSTITGNYGKQYLLTIISPYGSTNPAVGSHWYDAGTQFRNNPNSNQVQTPYVTPLEETVGGTTYQFVEWIGDGPSNNSADNIVGDIAYTHNFNLDGPKTVEAIWEEAITYYDVTFTQTGLESGLVSGVTLVLNVAGTDVFYSSIDGAPWYVTSIEEGYPINYSYSTVVAANTAGTQFALKSVTGLISGSLVYGNSTITGNYGKQYYLTVVSAYGNTSGEDWYDASTPGNPVYAYAGLDTGLMAGGVAGVDDIQYVFTNWSGNADGTDYAQSNAIEMTGPRTAVANWQTQYYLTILSDYSNTIGEGFKPANSMANAGLEAGTVAGGAPGDDIQYVFTNWSGNASGDNYAESNDIYMDGPKTAVANWKTQYYLTVLSEFGNTLGEGWYDPSTWWNLSTYAFAGVDINSYFVPFDTDAHLTGWDLNDSYYGPYIPWFDGNYWSLPIYMDGPKTAEAIWCVKYYLTVNANPSEVLTLDPGAVTGEGWYNRGTTASVSAEQNVDKVAGDSRYDFRYWSGDTTTTSGNQATVYMDSAKTVTANYQLQYHLTVLSEFGNTLGEGWYDPSTWWNLSTYAFAGVDINSYFVPFDTDAHLTGWDLNGSYYGPYIPWFDGNYWSLPIYMDGPKVAEAIWCVKYYLTVNTNPAEVLTLDPGAVSGSGWYNRGSAAFVFADQNVDKVAGDSRYDFRSWSGETFATFGNLAVVYMNSAKSVTANYQLQYSLTMLTNHGTVSPGNGWYDEGVTVAISSSAPGYIFGGWLGTGDGSYTGIINLSNVTMNSAIVQEAVWAPEGGASPLEDERTGLVIVIDVEGNIASYPVTPDGALLVDVTQTSPDGNLTLAIPMGTLVLNPDGTAAYHNADPDVIGIQAGAIASADGGSVIQAYDLTPAGLYFVNGEATLTAKYNSDNVPVGTNVTWSSYNADTGTWTDMETSGTVAAGGEPLAACNTSSLTVFALIAK